MLTITANAVIVPLGIAPTSRRVNFCLNLEYEYIRFKDCSKLQLYSGRTVDLLSLLIEYICICLRASFVVHDPTIDKLGYSAENDVGTFTYRLEEGGVVDSRQSVSDLYGEENLCN